MGGRGANPPADLFKNLMQSLGGVRRWGSGRCEEVGFCSSVRSPGIVQHEGGGLQEAGSPGSLRRAGLGGGSGHLVVWGRGVRTKGKDLVWLCLRGTGGSA